MHAHAESHAEGHTAAPRLVFGVWFALLAMTGIEVYLAYIHLAAALMLTLLMGLSVIKAGLIMAYFMHLRFERFSLFLTLVPALTLCICLILIFFFPDSFRLLQVRPPG